MDMDLWKKDLEVALSKKLLFESAAFHDRQLVRLDIGVFPWHGWIELSFLFSDEQCSEQDVASWPHYNFSDVQSGKWKELEKCCKWMAEEWRADRTKAEQFLMSVADVFKATAVSDAISVYPKGEKFEVTLFNADNRQSRNYCA